MFNVFSLVSNPRTFYYARGLELDILKIRVMPTLLREVQNFFILFVSLFNERFYVLMCHTHNSYLFDHVNLEVFMLI